jgi:hypothetical protein
VWQIVEDLGWYKESRDQVRARDQAQVEGSRRGDGGEDEEVAKGEEDVCDERMRRPRVHADVGLPEGWTVLENAECVFPSFIFLPY